MKACSQCVHFHSLQKFLGECRKFPPTLGPGGNSWVQPQVAPDDWCSQFLKAGHLVPMGVEVLGGGDNAA